jgi:ribosomal protein S21
MIEIICGHDIETSLLNFRRLLNKDAIFRELSLRRYAMTRTQRRKAKDGIAARRRRREHARLRKYSEEKKRKFRSQPTLNRQEI